MPRLLDLPVLSGLRNCLQHQQLSTGEEIECHLAAYSLKKTSEDRKEDALLQSALLKEQSKRRQRSASFCSVLQEGASPDREVLPPQPPSAAAAAAPEGQLDLEDPRGCKRLSFLIALLNATFAARDFDFR